MAADVELGEVSTWYEEHGEGEPLVLLHPGGAGVDARAWRPNLDALAAGFRVFTPERRGHGRTPDVEGPISFDLMAQDTIAFLETTVRARSHLVGCSDGATVALLVALRRPDLVSRLVLVAGVFHRDGWAPGVLDGPPPEFLERLYAELSPDGPEHYPILVEKLARMHAEGPTLSPADLSAVRARTLVMVADDDEVQLEHAIALYRGLADAELAVIPGTSHGLLVEKPAVCNAMIVEFLATDPVPTLAPIVRAERAGAR
jgi:pimeloyl-ACP methyl ester carboxylesterase